MISRMCSRLAGLSTLAAITALFAGSACVQDQDFLTIDYAVWYGQDDQECVLDASSAPVNRMTRDVSFPGEMAVGLAVTNRTSPNPGSNSGIDDSEIYMETAEVNLFFTGGGLSTSSYEYTLPSNSIGGGDTVAARVDVPAEVVSDMAAVMASQPPGSLETLEMEIVIRGRKANAIKGGAGKLGEVETRVYTFPFDVCYGCLSNCNACTDPETIGTCPSTENFVAVCGIAQAWPIVAAECAD